MLSVKKDFPILNSNGNKKPLIYFDSASTSQKPKAVINAISEWYTKHNANINRGAYDLAENSTELIEKSRKNIAEFINAKKDSVIFTKSATEGTNLVAQSWAKNNLKKGSPREAGDTILLTEMEHHANIVPWQLLAAEKKLKLKYWPIDKNGNLQKVSKEFFKGVKLLAITHVSNVLGVINKIPKGKYKILIDAAQSAGHIPIDVKKLNPDFLVFSGHKMFGPTGVGVLYVKPERFKEMMPYQSGGDSIVSVKYNETEFKTGYEMFESGTQPLAQIYGLNAAVGYINKIGISNIKKHNDELTNYAYEKLKEISEVNILGLKTNRSSLISFNVKNIHPHDLATWLNDYGIAIRAGHHCAQVLHDTLEIAASARISFHVYNNKKEIDYFIKTLKNIIKEWESSSHP